MVHQIVFSLASTLPFAIGQVQVSERVVHRANHSLFYRARTVALIYYHGQRVAVVFLSPGAGRPQHDDVRLGYLR